MATPLNTIKNWFKTGLKPTQAQFWASWEAFFHKDEKIPQGSIEGLQDSFNAKADTQGLATVALSGKYEDLIGLPDIVAPVIVSDIAVNLLPGDSLGKYKGSTVIPCAGWTIESLIKDIAMDYLPPSFGSSFKIDAQPTTVEVGTTLSGNKTFTWTLTLNNGVVTSIDIYDVTAVNKLVTTDNDGSVDQIITSRLLNADGQTQVWKGIANNTTGADVDSANFTVISRFNRYWGAVAALPDGTDNRAFANGLSKAFQASGSNTFTLATGTTEKLFLVFLPPTKTITSVIDLTNLGLDITSSYVLSTIVIKDAGGVDRTYNMYTMSIDEPYGASANHQIKTN